MLALLLPLPALFVYRENPRFPLDLKNSHERRNPRIVGRERHPKGREVRLYHRFGAQFVHLSLSLSLSSFLCASTLSLSGFFKDRDIPSLAINMHRLVNIERIPRQTRESKGIRRTPL